MRPPEDIIKQIKNTKIKTNPDVDKAILNDLLRRMNKTGHNRLNTWTLRSLICSRMLKFAVASLLIIATLFYMNQLRGSIDWTTVAWAEVVKHIESIDYVHFFNIETNKNGYSSILEGWYSDGKSRTRRYNKEQSFDNGKTWWLLDEHNNVIDTGKSRLAEYNNIFEALTYGMMSFNLSQFRNKTPISVGSDFLIYEFKPSSEKVDWIDKIAVTVGRNSLMPIQVKTYFKHDTWFYVNRLFVFDYEEHQKTEEFFKLPAKTIPPHGIGTVVLGEAETAIELHNTPGIKKAIVRLHTKFDGPAEDLPKQYRERYRFVDKPIYFMEITFVTFEFGAPGTGGTPLHIAIIANQLEAARMLIKNGADINARSDDEHGGTPLHWAAATGRITFVKLLLEAGANVNAADNNGYTPLDATKYHPDDAAGQKHEIAKLIKQHGGKTRSNFRSKIASPVIDIWKAAAEGNLDAIRRHVSAGTNINSTLNKIGTPGNGFTPLHFAVIANQMKAVKLLLDEGANINARADDGHGEPPLQLAVALGRLNLVKLLVEYGANVNAKDYYGNTPLDAISRNTESHAEIGELLRKHGGKTKRDLMFEYGMPTVDIWTAAAEGNIDTIRRHILTGTNINETFKGYRSSTDKKCPLWLGQGVRAELETKEIFPAKKYRNIRYTAVLRATGRKNVFTLELSCWLQTKQPD